MISENNISQKIILYVKNANLAVHFDKLLAGGHGESVLLQLGYRRGHLVLRHITVTLSWYAY